jgi:hypothetical protein
MHPLRAPDYNALTGIKEGCGGPGVKQEVPGKLRTSLPDAYVQHDPALLITERNLHNPRPYRIFHMLFGRFIDAEQPYQFAGRQEHHPGQQADSEHMLLHTRVFKQP